MKAIKYFINIIKKLDYILTKKQKKQSIGILFLLIISSLLEMLSVSAIIPVLYAISEPEKLLENHLVQTISNILGISFSSTQHLFLFICITVAIVYIFRGGLLIISHYITLSFENRLMKNVSLLILSSYLKRPYIEMTNINSAEAYRNIGNGSTSVYYEVQCLFLLVNNFLMIAVLVIFLISVDPIMALEILGGFLVIGSIILFAMKRPVKKSGIEFNDSCFLVGKNALEALNGIKEITILNRNDYFVDKYEEAVELKRKAELNFRFFQRFPNTLIETILIIILVVIVSFQSVSGTDSVQLISKLAAIGLAGLRVLPNVSGITSNSASMIFYATNFNEAYENIKEAREYVQRRELSVKAEENISEPLNFDSIKISNLSWKYPAADHYTLSNISFEIKKGESIGFIGKSGAGKSTLADIILGVLNPELHDAVTADGIDIFEIPKRWSKTVGYVPQSNFLLDDSIRNNILFGSQPEKDDKKIWEALEKAQLKDFVESLPDKLDTIVGERGVKFSGGQRQRISIARALYINPNLLVLDEATSALDNETEEAFMKSIEYLQGKITLIIIAHRLSTIEKCDKVFEIKNCSISEKQKVYQ